MGPVKGQVRDLDQVGDVLFGQARMTDPRQVPRPRLERPQQGQDSIALDLARDPLQET
jgi:hypothetical protein